MPKQIPTCNMVGMVLFLISITLIGGRGTNFKNKIMDKLIREERLKELKSRKRWEKIDNGVWFMYQTFMLSMGLDIAITFFIKGLSIDVEISWYFPLACLMLVIMLQTLYMVTKQHTENVKEIEDKYKNLIDKIN